MRTIKLTIAYDGTNYKGWQLQANGRTVQESVEKAVKKVFGKDHRVHGASRTDAGAHARGQVAHFKSSVEIPESNLLKALNAALPDDINIVKASFARDDFHSRFDAVSKHYRYYILNSRQRDPFRERYMARVPYELDVPLMRNEAKCLIGRHDYKSFQAKDKRERTSVRNISRINVSRKKNVITIDVEADGFLYNMVRNIVGTLVDIGRGYLPPGSMAKILRMKDRSQAGPTAVAKGLFLMEIRY